MNSNTPPDTLNATANLIINGIALFCCTNDDKFQIAFLREPKHTLSLEIVEISGGVKTPVAHTLNLEVGQALNLEASNPTQNSSTSFEASEFDRRNGLKDFRFLADLEGVEMHGAQLSLRDPKELGVTLLTVDNAHFYTRTLFGPVDKIQRPSGAKSEFGMIADIVGADISCGSGGKIILENAGGLNRIELEKRDGVRYEIIFQNICKVDVASSVTDFVLCYTVVSDPADVSFDLAPPISIFSGDDSCNGGRLTMTKDISSLLTSETISPS
jgi:hypothetical protein